MIVSHIYHNQIYHFGIYYCKYQGEQNVVVELKKNHFQSDNSTYLTENTPVKYMFLEYATVA